MKKSYGTETNKERIFDAVINGIIIAGVIGVVAMFMFIHYLGGWNSL